MDLIDLKFDKLSLYENILESFTNDMKNNLPSCDQCNYVGIIPIYVGNNIINEYKSDKLYTNVTKIQLLNDPVLKYFSMYKELFEYNVEYYLKEIFNYKSEDIDTIIKFDIKSVEMYICILS